MFILAKEAAPGKGDLAPRCDQAYIDLINRRKRLVRSSKAPFDPKKFLAKVGGGKTILYYRKNQIVFSQGEVAEAVFYIQQGNIKLIVVSEHGKEAVVAILGAGDFFWRRMFEWTPAAHRNCQGGR